MTDTSMIAATCQHQFTRGDKRGQTCPTRLLGQVANETKRCALHNPTKIESSIELSRRKKEELKAAEKVDDQPVFKKSQAARQAVVPKKKEPVASSTSAAGDYASLLQAYKQLSNDYEELANEHAALLQQTDNIGKRK